MATYLDRILDPHPAAADADRRDIGRLVADARARPPTRGFAAALSAPGGLSVIAEVKRASPSKGLLAPDLDPAVLAARYEAGGAACLSVLTDREFFSGGADDLIAARAAVRVPVLRKDFTVGAADVCDARLMGADAVLLIAAALSPKLLAPLTSLASEGGSDALVEVHDEDELEAALAVGARLIGINQRDLVTFEVDTARAERLAKIIPDGVVSVAESGIATPDDARRLAAAGFDAVLVGESLVTASDPAAAVAALMGSTR